ncbi:MAG: circularly permuted type 2 ATP-grasp protein [Pseudomonadota bacterium]
MYDEWRGTEGYHEHVVPFAQILEGTNWERLAADSERRFRQQGVTFALGESGSDTVERTIPFDPIPRLISFQEWQHLEAGLVQRVTALNAFLADIYSEQHILHTDILPVDIRHHSQYRAELRGCVPVHRQLANIAGIDLVRDASGHFFVLEDNLRVPSGVAYMLKNREALQAAVPDIFVSGRVAPVGHYPKWLYETLASLMPQESAPSIVLLTPGLYNSAYYEHVLLAESMGIPLVEGCDLLVEKNKVFWRSAKGLLPVHVIYRRIDDEFLDPDVFRADSMLGVKGLIRAYKAGNVAIANAPGTGVADDKFIYRSVPEMIRFYLNEEPILSNVPTYSFANPDIQQEVRLDPAQWVVKRVDGAGGYDMLIGATADAETIEKFLVRAQQCAEHYVVQPVLNLSGCPTLDAEGHLTERHVDLRPYVLAGETVRVVPGGLTRVALTPGSLVVNSSQGGGTKDTWVVYPEIQEKPEGMEKSNVNNIALSQSLNHVNDQENIPVLSTQTQIQTTIGWGQSA